MNLQPGSLPRWDLSNVFAGLETPEFDRAVGELTAKLDELDTFAINRIVSAAPEMPDDSESLAEFINGYLERINDIRLRYRTLMAYVYSYTTTDSYDSVGKRIHSELQILGVLLQKIEVRFQAWIGTLTKKPSIMEAVLVEEGSIGLHSFHLVETAEQSSYLMSQGEESLTSELSLSGGEAWEKLQEVVTSQLKAHFDDNGNIQDLPITVVKTFYNHPDRALRRQAYDVEMKALESVREPLAACLNGVKGEVNILNRRRGRKDALHSALDKARIDRDTLEVMLGTMRDSFPEFRLYWGSKASKLGLEQLPWWDLFAPLGQHSRRFTFNEAADFILDQFGTFSARLVDLCKQAFDRRWIDAEPRDGKVGGAFCMSIPAVEESRILCNFDGSFDQVATIAHELGHAYHNHCLVGKTQLQRRIPMTMAETASIFNQTIITDAMLAQATSSEQELGILESFLIDSGQIIVDVYSRFMFETEIFERRVEAELSADDYCEIMLNCQRETYGDGLDNRYLHPYMWAWKSHYYSARLSFYNFPYAFGLLFGLGLYAIYRQNDREFLTSYDRLLRDSGEATPADLASRFGIDIRRPEFWEESLKVVKERIARYIEIGE